MKKLLYYLAYAVLMASCAVPPETALPVPTKTVLVVPTETAFPITAEIPTAFTTENASPIPPVSIGYLQASPKSGEYVYISNPDGYWALYYEKGAKPTFNGRKITGSEFPVSMFTWSKDGTLVAFRNIDLSGQDICIVEIATPDIVTCVPAKPELWSMDDPNFSSDNDLTFTAFTQKLRKNQVYVYSRSTGEIKLFTNGVSGDYHNPQWSAKNMLAVENYNPDRVTSNVEIYGSDGTLYDTITGAIHGVWSADGSQFAFESNRIFCGEDWQYYAKVPYRDCTLWIYTVTTKQFHSFDFKPLINYFNNMAWSPDGSKIAFATGFHGDGYLFDLTTGKEQHLIRAYEFYATNPQWDGNSVIYWTEGHNGYTSVLELDINNPELPLVLEEK